MPAASRRPAAATAQRRPAVQVTPARFPLRLLLADYDLTLYCSGVPIKWQDQVYLVVMEELCLVPGGSPACPQQRRAPRCAAAVPRTSHSNHPPQSPSFSPPTHTHAVGTPRKARPSLPGMHLLQRNEAIEFLRTRVHQSGVYLLRPSATSSVYVLSLTSVGPQAGKRRGAAHADAAAVADRQRRRLLTRPPLLPICLCPGLRARFATSRFAPA